MVVTIAQAGWGGGAGHGEVSSRGPQGAVAGEWEKMK